MITKWVAADQRIDATETAEAILEARQRVAHGERAAQAKDARAAPSGVSLSRARALGTTVGAPVVLRHAYPLTSTSLTLVHAFDCDGARYVVARLDRARVSGFASLSDRERQVLAHLAIGQSTKETAYALGISPVTVRVLVARAATKLGVRSRAALLDHPEVRLLCTAPKASQGS